MTVLGKRRDVLFFQKVDQLDVTVLSEVPLQSLLCERLKVLNVSDVYIPRGARVNGKSQSRG